MGDYDRSDYTITIIFYIRVKPSFTSLGVGLLDRRKQSDSYI